MNSSKKESQKRSRMKRKRYLIPLIVIALLVVLRILLPFFVKNYVNNVLADIPGYYGQVDDIDIALIRGAYVIHGLYLNKADAGTEIPFLDFEKTDISVEWKSLFKGKIVSELVLTRPVVIYTSENQKESEDVELDDWTRALTDLVPIAINHLQIIDGKAAFVEITAEPTIDLNLNGIELDATNLRNVVQVERNLPSEVVATATSIGGGQVSLNGKMNLVKQIPDMDVSFSLENATITAFNDFTNHYAGIDFSEGQFNLFSEIAIADGYLTGYIKPLLKDSKLVSKNDGFFEKIWEGFVGFFKFVLKNQKNDTLATKAPLEGDLNNVQTNVWSTIFSIIQNGWINAFKNADDNEVTFEDAEQLADDSDGSKEEKDKQEE